MAAASARRDRHPYRTLIVGIVFVATVVLVSATLSDAANAVQGGAAAFRTAGTELADATVHSHAAAISTGPNTTTPGFGAPSGSTLFVFVGYVNQQIGGGYISSISDSKRDAFWLVTSTYDAQNHTEVLYEAHHSGVSVPHLTVTVRFKGGDTVMGGAVAAIDVVGAPTSGTNQSYAATAGSGTHASVPVGGSVKSDLFLLGVMGQARAAAMTAGAHEHLFETAGATAGPFEDGMSYGIFSSTDRSGAFNLTATLNGSSVWDGVGIVIPATAVVTGGSSEAMSDLGGLAAATVLSRRS